MIKLIGPFTSGIGLNECPLKVPLMDVDLALIPDAGILIKDNRIEQFASFAALRSAFPNAAIIEVEQEACVVPGFIDAHTHIAFAGSRARDFYLRNSGVSYLEISEQGGGIWDTVQKTRNASQQELEALVISRSEGLARIGVTTAEVKSGYGLTVDEESKTLRSIQDAKEKSAIDLISTCLAAHIKPKDFGGSSTAYLEWIGRELLPKLNSELSCNRVDIFIEKTAFQIQESRDYLQVAKTLGLDIVIHADQFTPMGSHLAVELGAVSADHLEASGPDEIAAIAHSDVVAMALPGASIGLGEPFAPARKLLDAGACLAIASDWNPGSAPMGNLITQASILATYQKLSCAELLAAITCRASRSLRLEDRGKLEKGMLADFNIYPVSDFREIFYNQGSLLPSQVWKSGNRIV